MTPRGLPTTQGEVCTAGPGSARKAREAWGTQTGPSWGWCLGVLGCMGGEVGVQQGVTRLPWPRQTPHSAGASGVGPSLSVLPDPDPLAAPDPSTVG